MARPEKIKTPLGQRLTDVRKALGYETRAPFAELLSIPLETLGGYERGIREPDSNYMAMYHDRFGIDLTWLLTGGGEMFADLSKAPASSRAINKRLMHKLARLAREVRKELGAGVHGETITEDAADLYNELLTLVNGVNDMEEVEVTLPRLRLMFKRKLQEQSGDQEEGRNIA
ncbi:transcriptional regulator [Brucella pseudogrignonensis]|uniref:XRE family transcriptional regulator n=1 Tax=Brucella pseudogrignonensis TaxID=419475 RepID=A0A7Y3T438_9HYPH|nr:helix-turn-helix transcriptional regulator [Brucella pseudogrignonensis]MCM0751914.1 transcriptional regulator [Brucella pseudogrignonensis]NNV20689.1 XRE family transcriptional regulator [Brucella pseudogrignonensis]